MSAFKVLVNKNVIGNKPPHDTGYIVGPDEYHHPLHVEVYSGSEQQCLDYCTKNCKKSETEYPYIGRDSKPKKVVIKHKK